MTSYTSQPNIPTLTPVDNFTDDEQPLRDKLNKIYTDIANIVNDKKRKDQYLQQEDITADVWVNGKAIFRQTFPTGTLAATNTNPITTNIKTIDTLVLAYGSITNGTTQKTLPYSNPDATQNIAVDVTSTQILLTTGAGMPANYSGYITIFYTKV